MVDRKEIRHMFNELETPFLKLSSWEVDFISSITDLFENGEHDLSERQIKCLEKIYKEKGEF